MKNAGKAGKRESFSGISRGRNSLHGAVFKFHEELEWLATAAR
jgi:hypothetical protein